MTTKKSLLVWVLVSLTVVMVSFYGIFFTKARVSALLANGDNMFWTLEQRIPPELEVKVKNGEVSINKERPYCLILESKSKIGVYFSNSVEPTLPKEEECGAMVTVGKNYILTSENGSYKVHKIDAKADYTINKGNIENFYQTNRPKVERVVWSLFYIGSWIIWLIIFGWGLLNCLWYTWVAKMGLKIFQSRNDLAFNQIYGVVLFMMATWWFLRYGLLYIIVNIYFQKNVAIGFPFMNTLILIILALIWYKNYDKKKEVNK